MTTLSCDWGDGGWVAKKAMDMEFDLIAIEPGRVEFDALANTVTSS